MSNGDLTPSLCLVLVRANLLGRDNLHEQNGLGDEITEAMNSLSMSNNQIDDVDLDAELEELQQEQVDEELLKLHDTPVPKEHIAGHKEGMHELVSDVVIFVRLLTFSPGSSFEKC